MARPRSYRTARALERAVRRFFDSISYERPVTERVDSGEKDADGHKIYWDVPVKNKLGEELKVTLWAQPPELGDLCRYLGINRSTWSRYGENADEGYADVVEYARSVIESYWARSLNGKASAGAQFTLKHNFGWTDRQEVTITGSVEDYIAGRKEQTGEEQGF